MATRTLRTATSGISDPAGLVQPLLDALNRIIVGKPNELKLCLACLLARGHLLIEDLPGVGKTTLAHALARVMDLSFQRVQFTSDLLPADVIGVSIFRRDTSQFEFHKGPIFSQLLLADEINRATPKAQSALLEAMEERQVTADGSTYGLPSPFFVVATRNPTQQIGTFPLPESQLDRFLMQITLGYPGPAEERLLLANGDRRDLVDELPPLMSVETLLTLQHAVGKVHLSDPLLDYVQALVAYTRDSGEFTEGLSPRGAIALVRAAQAWAMMSGHDGVYPEDVQAVLPCVTAHRLEIAQGRESDPAGVGQTVLDAVPVT
ncbi:MAG: AAA family ATPase [Gammaproteobacteria bacterium]|nr:AAA family ATPase [Gammaproteobacteria bacterium]MDH3507375.1 AAA family ATPase [Gammaproteobacteria bacterium]